MLCLSRVVQQFRVSDGLSHSIVVVKPCGAGNHMSYPEDGAQRCTMSNFVLPSLRFSFNLLLTTILLPKTGFKIYLNNIVYLYPYLTCSHFIREQFAIL